MSTVRNAARLGLALTLSAAAAGAQTDTLRITAPSPANPTVTVSTNATTFGTTNQRTHVAITNGQYSTSPFTATLTPSVGAATTLQVFCADLLNSFNFNTKYAVRSTNIGTMTTTQSTTRWTGADGILKYKKASFLAGLFATAPRAQWDDLQMAMWEVMTPNTLRNDVASWTSSNAAHYVWAANHSASIGFANVDFSQALVITAASIQGLGANDGRRFISGNQEFVTAARVVPEPSTYALMGTGLLALAGVARRRRTQG